MMKERELTQILDPISWSFLVKEDVTYYKEETNSRDVEFCKEASDSELEFVLTNDT